MDKELLSETNLHFNANQALELTNAVLTKAKDFNPHYSSFKSKILHVVGRGKFCVNISPLDYDFDDKEMEAFNILEGEGFSYDIYPDLSNKHRVYAQVSWR